MLMSHCSVYSGSRGRRGLKCVCVCVCVWLRREESHTCESTPALTERTRRTAKPEKRQKRRDRQKRIEIQRKKEGRIGQWPHLLDSTGQRTEPKDSDPSNADNNHLNGRTFTCTGERGLLLEFNGRGNSLNSLEHHPVTISFTLISWLIKLPCKM